MCGRYTITVGLDEIVQTFSIEQFVYHFDKRYNVAPTQMVPGIVNIEGKRVLQGFKWGLIPFWSKDSKIAYRTINARSEGIEKKPSFRHLLKGNRILITSDGFYEWKQEEKVKQPYRFQLKSKEVFAFAGLYDTWKNEKEEVIHSCTIITTTPNELVSTVHDRMPVILTGREAEDWISPDLNETEEVLSYLKAFPAELMFKYPVSKDVGNVKNAEAALIEEVPLNSK